MVANQHFRARIAQNKLVIVEPTHGMQRNRPEIANIGRSHDRIKIGRVTGNLRDSVTLLYSQGLQFRDGSRDTAGPDPRMRYGDHLR